MSTDLKSLTSRIWRRFALDIQIVLRETAVASVLILGLWVVTQTLSALKIGHRHAGVIEELHFYMSLAFMAVFGVRAASEIIRKKYD